MVFDFSSVAGLKRVALQVAHAAKEGHIPSSFSILDILWVLYADKDKLLTAEDSFVLSKGHAGLGLYAILAKSGAVQPDELMDFGTFGSRLGGHPDRNKVPEILASTGSLGHGVPIAVGVSMARKITGRSGRVFVLAGDGEMNEGSVWESCMIASHHNLSNFTLIIDNNESGSRAVDLGDLGAKLTSFGFEVSDVDGHHHGELRSALRIKHESKPTAVIARTIKGQGVLAMHNNPAWHHRIPDETELASFLEELT
jgi:transketolase